MADVAASARILIAGGGTGGHVYPGLAVAEEWMRRQPGSEVVFVGTERGLEATAVPRAGYRLRTIAARGIPRRPGFAMLRALAAFVASLAQTWRILGEERPAVVLATGGYVSGPVGLLARLRGIPLVVQEQNSIPGATNRWLSLVATEVHISFLESRSYFRRRDNLKVTGNPIRRSLLRQDRASAYETLRLDPAKRTLLVFGGSRGASNVNRAVGGALALLARVPRLQVLWQTGEADAEAARTEAAKTQLPVRVMPYIQRMDAAYAVADLALCRAGAMTIAELTACGVPAILVPYPFATHDHQTHNAAGLVDRGAAEMIADKDLEPVELARRIEALLRDESRLRRLGRNARAFSRTNAAERIAASLEALVPPDAGARREAEPEDVERVPVDRGGPRPGGERGGERWSTSTGSARPWACRNMIRSASAAAETIG
ncbi:MAG TPA: undecaprenyldiphospho-muramoylpentapeptide beta-N-acetylglucosaminyltransferase [Acidobacteriota bacterium]|nr:undecaprenyldiphospho-muramoylpentapeptide beta-N-acetylglucosaminyltransferase [Acidobacteriota bacterium]